jgi:mannose-6-phosphate isomerase-like protein (cupin superfamily)
VKSLHSKIETFTAKDGSLIRELMHPSVHGNRNQSLAEAVVPAGTTTQLHRHLQSEEIYHITAGEGRMTLGQEVFTVQAGDTVCIPPGTPHNIANTGGAELRILCCCAPAYSHNDTDLLE